VTPEVLDVHEAPSGDDRTVPLGPTATNRFFAYATPVNPTDVGAGLTLVHTWAIVVAAVKPTTTKEAITGNRKGFILDTLKHFGMIGSP
jgi:hypothetical protein